MKQLLFSLILLTGALQASNQSAAAGNASASQSPADVKAAAAALKAKRDAETGSAKSSIGYGAWVKSLSPEDREKVESDLKVALPQLSKTSSINDAQHPDLVERQYLGMCSLRIGDREGHFWRYKYGKNQNSEPVRTVRYFNILISSELELAILSLDPAILDAILSVRDVVFREELLFRVTGMAENDAKELAKKRHQHRLKPESQIASH